MDTNSTFQHIKWIRKPALNNPVLILGFDGWSNAGGVSTDCLDYLRQNLPYDALAFFHAEPFLIFTEERPVASVEEGVVYDLESDISEVCLAQNGNRRKDLIFMIAKEPNLLWGTYCRTIFEIVKQLNIGLVITIGGVMDSVSATSPPKISVVASSPEMVDEVLTWSFGVFRARYQGPVSIHTRLIEHASALGIKAVSLWAHVPPYVRQSPGALAKLITLLNVASGSRIPVNGVSSFSSQSETVSDADFSQIGKEPSLRSGPLDRTDDDLSNDNVIRMDEFLKKDSTKDPES